MLHLKFALNLEHLADEMIEEISKNWNDPFNAPVVIFPDFKLEQWFRLKWIKKKGSLLNLNKSTIDKFLFDILVGDGTSTDDKGNDILLQKITADMLRNVILAYLEQEDAAEKRPHWQTLGNEVKRYLFGDGEPKPEDSPDENRLFDFANKMAALFLEYETSRPKGFARNANGNAPGILEKWNNDGLSPFFAESNSDVAERENWQMELYSAIFHRKGNSKSLLEDVFDKEAAITGEPKQFQTIPYLYSQCLNAGGGKDAKFHDEKFQGVPVFIFGLSGMGQFYRVILQEYAKNHEIHAYIQNPCMEFWEDSGTALDKVCRQWNVRKGEWKSGQAGDIGKIKNNMHVQSIAENSGTEPVMDIEDIPEELSDENELLISWGRSGRDNIKLWCQATDYDFEFNGIDGNDLPQDTLLHKVQYAIAHRTDSTHLDAGDITDNSLTVTAAPTRIREIEHLHSEICKLLQNGTRIEDILVVSPCLDDYRTAIKMVFDQTPAKPKKGDDNLHIPFAIVDSPAKNSLTENALESLFAILDQGTITRPDFFCLVRNPVVQSVRKIDNDEVEAWQEWVAETNTFRKRENANGKGDWGKAVRRLLLAQMTSNDTTFEGETLRPFSDMACSDKNSLCKFVECISDLEKWIVFGKNRITSLETLAENIDKWIAMQYTPDSLKSESVIYKRVAEGLKRLRWQFDAGATGISQKIAEQTLLQAAQSTEYSCGNLFVNGVTFMKFAPNRILPVKHLFFIGADAMSFPGSRQHNTLDLRKSLPPWPGDESPVAKNRYGFLCQLMSTGEGFHLSYVNKDIKKDAELYPSSVVNDLRKFIEKGAPADNPQKWEEKSISLDENRVFSELFTPKSLRNKDAYERMFLKDDGNSQKPGKKSSGKQRASEKGTPQKQKEYLVKLPERVGIYALANFLKDPFQFRIGQMLIEEDDEDIEKELFEPIFFNHLDTSIVLKKMLAAELSNETDELEKFKNELNLKGKSPDGEFGKKQWKSLEAKKNLILEQMENNAEEPGLIEQIKASWSFGQKIQDLQFSRADGTHWLLSGKLSWSNSKDIASTTHLIEITSSGAKNTGIPFDKYMPPYVKALALIAHKGEVNPQIANENQKIDISIYSCDKEQKGPAKTFVEMTPNAAKDKLEEIYANAFGDEKTQTLPYSKSVPVDLLDNSKVTNIYSYADALLDGPWNYFDKKSLFNPCDDTGFSAENFKTEWSEAVTKMKSLIAIKKYTEEA